MEAGIISISSISNPRTPDGGWEDEKGCDFCGSVTGAYISMQERNNMSIIICKGCLSKWSKIIDKTILEQSKTRV